MSKGIHQLFGSLLLLGLCSTLVPTGTRAGTATILPVSLAPYNIPYFGDPSFEKLWRRTDPPGTDGSSSWTADGAGANSAPYSHLLEAASLTEGHTELYAPHRIDDIGRAIGSFFAPLRDYAELRNAHAR
jgi:hypothetical protein